MRGEVIIGMIKDYSIAPRIPPGRDMLCVCRIALMASQCFDQGFHQGHADMTTAHKKNMLMIKEKRGQPCDTN